MLDQTLKCLQEDIVQIIEEEKILIETAYDRLRYGEILSIGLTGKVKPPDEDHPQIELLTEINFVVERRKVRKKRGINEEQVVMEFKGKKVKI